MAWTQTIATAVTGEIAPASMWNAVRDNFALVGPHLIVRKPSDEGPISSTTYQADNDLIAPVGANEVWVFMLYTRWVTTGASNIKMQWTFPASAVMAAGQFIGRNTAGTVVDQANQTATSPLVFPASAEFAPTTATSGFVIGPMWMMFVNGANAGNFALEWAPNAAINLTLKANSTLWGVKLA